MNVSPATKAAAISDYLAGKGEYFQIALEFGINPYRSSVSKNCTLSGVGSVFFLNENT